MKQTNINIDEIKRFPTVTNPIKADDLHTPQAYAYTLRRAIVTDCNDRQRAELVTLLEGKDTAEGVTFNNTQLNRDRLHIWQNQESRRERAAILGEGWKYSGDLNDGTPHANPGDEITCIDGTTGICTKASPEIVCSEFETADGRALTVAGYFFRAPSAFNAKYYKELITAEWWGNDPRPFQFGDHSFSCIYKGGDMWDILSADGTRQQDLTTDELADFLEEEYKYSRKAAAKSEAPKPQPSAWVTGYTADDFLKMEANPEAIEADGDIIGKRLRHCQSGGLGELQVFIQDYAGNERHAIYYIWDEFMQEVRANVRPLDWLRRHFCPANGWHEVAA